jgi:hypothetical protein
VGAAAEHWPAAFGLLITAFKAVTYAIQPNEADSICEACYMPCAVLQCICQVPTAAAADMFFDVNSSTLVNGSNTADVTAAAAAAAAAVAGSSTGAADSDTTGAEVAPCSSSSSIAAAAATGELGVLQLLLVSHSLMLLAQATEAALSAEQPAAAGEAEVLFFQAVMWLGPGCTVKPLHCVTVAAQWLQRSLQKLSGHAVDGFTAADASAAAAAAAEPGDPAAEGASSSSAAAAAGSGGRAAEQTPAAAAAAEPEGALSPVPPQLLAWLLRQCRYVAGRQQRIRWEQYHVWLQSQESEQEQQEQQQREELQQQQQQQQREKQQDKKPRIALRLVKRL